MVVPFFNRLMPPFALMIMLLSMNVSMIFMPLMQERYCSTSVAAVPDENGCYGMLMPHDYHHDAHLNNVIAQRDVNLCKFILGFAACLLLISLVHVVISSFGYVFKRNNVLRDYIYALLPQKKPER